MTSKHKNDSHLRKWSAPAYNNHTVFEIFKPNEHIWNECISKLDDEETDLHADIAQAFRVFDSNKDGYLCIEDVKRMLLNIDETMSPQDIKNFMAFGDRDNDGLLNYKDFQEMMLKSPLSPLTTSSK